MNAFSFRSLNPFENQVYFYGYTRCDDCGDWIKGLNPFENQVYFYAPKEKEKWKIENLSLNPFENQVYFYNCTNYISGISISS